MPINIIKPNGGTAAGGTFADPVSPYDQIYTQPAGNSANPWPLLADEPTGDPPPGFGSSNNTWWGIRGPAGAVGRQASVAFDTFTIPSGYYIKRLSLWVSSLFFPSAGAYPMATFIDNVIPGSIAEYSGKPHPTSQWDSISATFAPGQVSQAILDAYTVQVIAGLSAGGGYEGIGNHVRVYDMFTVVETAEQLVLPAATFTLEASGPGQPSEDHYGGTFPKVLF